MDYLISKRRRAPNLKNRVDDSTEQSVIRYAIDYPVHGQHRTSNELRKQSVFISGMLDLTVLIQYTTKN